MTFEVAKDFVIEGLLAASAEMDRTGIFVIPEGLREPAISVLRRTAVDPGAREEYARLLEENAPDNHWNTRPFGFGDLGQAREDAVVRDGLDLLSDQELVEILIDPSYLRSIATVLGDDEGLEMAGHYWVEAVKDAFPQLSVAWDRLYDRYPDEFRGFREPGVDFKRLELVEGQDIPGSYNSVLRVTKLNSREKTITGILVDPGNSPYEVGRELIFKHSFGDIYGFSEWEETGLTSVSLLNENIGSLVNEDVGNKPRWSLAID